MKEGYLGYREGENYVIEEESNEKRWYLELLAKISVINSQYQSAKTYSSKTRQAGGKDNLLFLVFKSCIFAPLYN
jgi:hypothetical protein